MFNLIIFIICFLIMVFISGFLYMGGTIYDLISTSKYIYIYTKIEKDINMLIEKYNTKISYNIPINESYIYQTDEDNIKFNPLLNQIIVTDQNRRYVFDIKRDMDQLVPIFAALTPTFDFERIKLKTN